MTDTTPPPRSDEPSGGVRLNWSAALAANERWLRTVVFARLGEPQAVDEVLQEVALAAIAQRAPLHDPARIAAWLYRIAIRQALLHRRRCGRRHRLLRNYAGTGNGRGPSSSADPLEWLLLDERRGLIRQALARLPRRDAEILLLKYTEDWSYRELADRLGIRESAIEARLHRARQRLREALIATRAIEVKE